MKISLQNFNGFFQVAYHTRIVRLLWLLSILVSLAIITFGIWTIVVEFFDSSQSFGQQFDQEELIILLILVLPVLGIIIGAAKIRRKPGIYLSGIRFSNSGIEIGTLTLDVNSGLSKNRRKKKNAYIPLEGNWKQEKTIHNEIVNFLISLRTGHDQSSGIFFERFVVTSGNDILYQMIGNNSIENSCKDLVSVSNGSIQLLANSNGITPDKLLHFLSITADTISICRKSSPPHCTLRIAPSPTNHGGTLAVGVLGGLNSVSGNSFEDKGYLEQFFGMNFKRLLQEFLKERRWILDE